MTEPDDMDYCSKALGIVSNQFEEEGIVGPYWEAIGDLSGHEKARLFLMAVRAVEPYGWLHLVWALGELVKIVPTGDTTLDNEARSVLKGLLDEPSRNSVDRDEGVDAWLAAIRGWAKLERSLPAPPAAGAESPNNWHLLGKLFFNYEHNDSTGNAGDTWEVLLGQPSETIANLYRLETATFGTDSSGWRRQPALARLVEDYPEPLRRLFESALDYDSDLSPSQGLDTTARASFAMRVLGSVGTEATATMLEPHTLDPETGIAAVEAIRQINRRIAP